MLTQLSDLISNLYILYHSSRFLWGACVVQERKQEKGRKRGQPAWGREFSTIVTYSSYYSCKFCSICCLSFFTWHFCTLIGFCIICNIHVTSIPCTCYEIGYANFEILQCPFVHDINILCYLRHLVTFYHFSLYAVYVLQIYDYILFVNFLLQLSVNYIMKWILVYKSCNDT